MKYRALAAIVLAIALSGCAYNYAGKEGKTQREPAKDQDSQVVKLEKDPAVTPPVDETHCGIPSFEVHYYSASSASTKTVDCATREVANVARAPLGETTYQELKSSGVPEDKWYIEVDPTGLRAAFLNNDQLLKMSPHFEIEFFGRDSQRGVLIYLFLEKI